MKAATMLLLLCAVASGGCSEKAATMNEADGAADGTGRYAGIGIYPADPLWEQVQGLPEAKDVAAARLADDAQIIVVVDRQTGEVRQCGNKSGFCIAMNPWAGRTAHPVPMAPVMLSKHADELNNEAEPVNMVEPDEGAQH